MNAKTIIPLSEMVCSQLSEVKVCFILQQGDTICSAKMLIQFNFFSVTFPTKRTEHATLV